MQVLRDVGSVPMSPFYPTVRYSATPSASTISAARRIRAWPRWKGSRASAHSLLSVTAWYDKGSVSRFAHDAVGLAGTLPQTAPITPSLPLSLPPLTVTEPRVCARPELISTNRDCVPCLPARDRHILANTCRRYRQIHRRIRSRHGPDAQRRCRCSRAAA